MREKISMKISANFKAEIKRDFIFLFWMVISASIHAISLSTFSIPAKLYPGGFSGVTRILVDLARDYLNLVIPFGVIYGLLNILLTIFVYRKIGKHFAIFSVIQYSLVSLFTLFFKPIIPVSDPLLIAVFGGILAGFGISMALAHDASSGGFDFVAIYVSNRYHIQVWNYVMFVNICILCCAGMLYGWEKALYSIILQFCSTQVINRLHKRYRMLTLTIITSLPNEVEKEILGCVRHGITEICSRGVYQHKDNTFLYIIINSFQERSVINAILKADPHAFINIQDTRKIVGNYYQKPLD